MTKLETCHDNYVKAAASRSVQLGLIQWKLQFPESAFAEWREDRDWHAAMAAKRARGEKLDSEIRSTLMRCVCGTTFDSWRWAESYPHRAHITAAQATSGTRR
ncbi:hypothetical protein ABIB81_009601 [Bradyrhizobium sp. I1.7.5]